MNKNDFTNELKELMSSMSEEEIEKTINALSSCRTAVYKKVNREKSRKAMLFSTASRYEAELQYIGAGAKTGTLKTVGASLLTDSDFVDFGQLRSVIPYTTDNWWLHNGYLVSDNRINWMNIKKGNGKIRPVIIIDHIHGDLTPGEAFCINDESFILLTELLAIRAACFDEFCSYTAVNYECSIARFCVDGWYMKLINDNKTSKQQTAGEV